MKSKLTLSLPDKVISEAKQIARQRKTTVSALFAESMQFWTLDKETRFQGEDSSLDEMSDLLGVFEAQAAFDERSSQIRAKHG